MSKLDVLIYQTYRKVTTTNHRITNVYGSVRVVEIVKIGRGQTHLAAILNPSRTVVKRFAQRAH